MTSRISAADLIERYDGFLLDAYGVLITSSGGVPGASLFLERLAGAGKPFVVVTNDASRSRAHSSASYRRRGLTVQPDRIITTGGLLESAGIGGQRCIVLGTEDATDYARAAGCQIVAPGEDADVLVVADEAGYDFLPTIDATVSMIVRRVRAGHDVRLLLPNPDCIYPKTADELGLASGAIAAMISAALRAALGPAAPEFEPLGKPHAAIFEHGLKVLGTPRDRTVMVGDQLETDVRGAIGIGLDAALVLTGVARPATSDVQPTWILQGLGDPTDASQ